MFANGFLHSEFLRIGHCGAQFPPRLLTSAFSFSLANEVDICALN